MKLTTRWRLLKGGSAIGVLALAFGIIFIFSRGVDAADPESNFPAATIEYGVSEGSADAPAWDWGDPVSEGDFQLLVDRLPMPGRVTLTAGPIIEFTSENPLSFFETATIGVSVEEGLAGSPIRKESLRVLAKKTRGIGSFLPPRDVTKDLWCEPLDNRCAPSSIEHDCDENGACSSLRLNRTLRRDMLAGNGMYRFVVEVGDENEEITIESFSVELVEQ